MLGVVGLDLLPEAIEAAGEPVFGVPMALLLFVGELLVAHLVERLLSARQVAHGAGGGHHGDRVPQVGLTAAAAMSCPASTASLCRSATGTRPRCREGVATCGARRITPSTGSPDSSSASRNSASCRSDATLFRITPPIRTSGSHEGEPVDQGRHRPGLRGGVHHQHHGRLQQLGDLRGRRQLPLPRGTVVQPHHALDHGEVASRRPVREERGDEIRPAHVRVEIFRPGRPVAR
ncbi:hypothetical protein SBADM41S_01890 [Streptomyces badius]